MTRINCVDPELLTDQHLFIEFREITRVRNLARELKDYGNYVMGEGHVKFFYNKSVYLAKRLVDIQAEMDKRKIWQYTPKEYGEHSPGLNEDWQPDRIAKLTNTIRLDSRVREAEPGFYRYYGKPVDSNFYLPLFEV